MGKENTNNDNSKYTRIEKDEDYFWRFGVKINGSKYNIYDEKKLEKAYEKAWENRNYEIDKFWSRSLYFWGFIAATFVAYTAIITSENAKIIQNSYLDICVIVLGIIFSYAWCRVIQGSKRWQENWEKHIDYLENFVSGPIYKTVYYQKTRHFSVSRISEYTAWTVLGFWILVFCQSMISHMCPEYKICDWVITLIILAGGGYMIYKISVNGKKNFNLQENEICFIYRKRKNDLEKEEEEKK